MVSGELLAGTLCKKSLGAAPGGLVHTIWEEQGPDATRGFLSQTQTLVNYWLLQESFSIGIGDTIADEATMIIINNTIQVAKNEVKALIKQAQEKQLEQQPGRTLQESFENRVNQVRTVDNQSISQSVTWSNTRSLTPSITQSTDQSRASVKQSFSQTISLSSASVNQSVKQSVNESIKCISQSIRHLISHSSASVNQSGNQSDNISFKCIKQTISRSIS